MNDATMAVGIIGGWLYFGIELNKFDVEHKTVYITLPAHAESYDKYGTSPDSVASRIKQTFELLGIEDFKLKYREKDIYWTEQMGNDYYKANIGKVRDMVRFRKFF